MNIHDVLENAGRETEMPGGKIPSQWLPGIFRWPVLITVLPFVWLDQFGQKVAKLIIRPPNILVGKCKKRGNCCHYIMIRKTRAPFGWLDLFWHTQINGFFRRDKKVHMYHGMPIYIMGCRYLKKNGECGRYMFRPAICRSWPKVEYFGHPQILKGCGFSAKLRKSESKLNVLD